jgi:hypothetical protein
MPVKPPLRRDGRRHECPDCLRLWYCLADRAELDCVYPDALICPTCVREAH